MSTATLNAKGQVVIPADIRSRHGLTPGTQVEFVDDGGVIRLIVRRKVPPSDPASGYGLVKVPPAAAGSVRRRLSDFDAAATLAAAKTKRK